MITRIELTNFMSHEHTVIEPAPGLTVLVGPNNCGKSAVVAALQILCHNENSTYVLRHGERECSVRVETDDGHTIEWRRKSAPSYVIDGNPRDRLGRNCVPDELHQALRLPKVEAGDEADFDVHFGTQKSPVFLIGNSSANAARFFASSSDALRLVQMQRRHREKLREAQREKSCLEAESRLLNAELTALEPVIEADRQLKALDSDFCELGRHEAESAALAEIADALTVQARVVARHAAEVTATRELATPPARLPTEELAKLIGDLEQSKSSLEKVTGLVQSLAPLRSPPAMHDTTTLETLCREVERHEHVIAADSGRQRAFIPLAHPPVLHDTATIEALGHRLEAAARAASVANKQEDVLRSVTAPPEIADESPLANLIDSLETAANQARRCQGQLAAVSPAVPPPTSTDTSPLETAISQLMSAWSHVENRTAELETAESVRAQAEVALRSEAADSMCPLCGAPLDADRLLTCVSASHGGHDHG